MSDPYKINWGTWNTCKLCNKPETVFEDTPENREHWAWGIFRTQSQYQFSLHEKSPEHLVEYRKFYCNECDVQCPNETVFNNHCKTSRHKKLSNIVIVCQMCNYETSNISHMRQHEESKGHREAVKNGGKQNGYECTICEYTTQFKSHYQQHINTKRHQDKIHGITATTKPEFRCDPCGYTTQFKHHLEQHMKTKRHISTTHDRIEDTTHLTQTSSVSGLSHESIPACFRRPEKPVEDC